MTNMPEEKRQQSMNFWVARMRAARIRGIGTHIITMSVLVGLVVSSSYGMSYGGTYTILRVSMTM